MLAAAAHLLDAARSGVCGGGTEQLRDDCYARQKRCGRPRNQPREPPPTPTRVRQRSDAMQTSQQPRAPPHSSVCSTLCSRWVSRYQPIARFVRTDRLEQLRSRERERDAAESALERSLWMASADEVLPSQLSLPTLAAVLLCTVLAEGLWN